MYLTLQLFVVFQSCIWWVFHCRPIFYVIACFTFLFEKLKAEPHPHCDTPLNEAHGRFISGTCSNNERRLRDSSRNFSVGFFEGAAPSGSLDERSFDSLVNTSSELQVEVAFEHNERQS